MASDSTSKKIFKTRFFKKPWTALAVIVWGFGFASMACGDVVWIRGNPIPIFGALVEKNDSGIRIRVFESGKYRKTVSFGIETIEQIIVNQDPDRLASLDPDDLSAYHAYAEELESQANDPSAIHLARRLYLITAAHSDNELRRSAMLGLIGIANSNIERKRLKLLLFLTDPDSSLTRLDLSPAASTPLPSEEHQQVVLELVQAIRKGKSVMANSILARENTQEFLEIWPPVLSVEEFKQMAIIAQPNPSQLEKLLSIELEIVTRNREPDQRTKMRLLWGDFATQSVSGIGPLPSLENVTPFSPRRTRFRNGVWIEPN